MKKEVVGAAAGLLLVKEAVIGNGVPQTTANEIVPPSPTFEFFRDGHKSTRRNASAITPTPAAQFPNPITGRVDSIRTAPMPTPEPLTESPVQVEPSFLSDQIDKSKSELALITHTWKKPFEFNPTNPGLTAANWGDTKVEVRNYGAPSSETTATLSINGVRSASVTVKALNTYNGSTGFTTIEFNNAWSHTMPEGKYNFKVCVDEENVVPETYEEVNNCLETEVNTGADLATRDTRWTLVPSQRSQGFSDYELFTTVYNRGTKPSQVTYGSVVLDVNGDGQGDLGGNGLSVRSLAPGDSTTISSRGMVRTSLLQTGGSGHLVGCADTAIPAQVEETEEGNNCGGISVGLLPIEATPTPNVQTIPAVFNRNGVTPVTR